MTAKEILDCIIYMEIGGEDLMTIQVPAEDDKLFPQDEEWWFSIFGGCPPAPIEEGEYLVLIPNDARDWLQTESEHFLPDAELENGDGIVYLYKIEEK